MKKKKPKRRKVCKETLFGEPPKPKEKDLQKVVEQYLKLRKIIFCHPVTRCPKCGMTFRGTQGFPDICFISGGIELKVGKNKQQPIQEAVEEWFKRQGKPYKVCRSLDEVKEIIG